MRFFFHMIKMLILINIVIVFFMGLFIQKCINYYLTKPLHKIDNIEILNDLMLIDKNNNNSLILNKESYIEFNKNKHFDKLNIIKIMKDTKNISYIFLLYDNQSIINLKVFTPFPQKF